MKKFIYCLVAIVLAGTTVSCTDLLEFWGEDGEENIPYKEIAYLYIENKTNQVLRFELNYGDDDIDEIQIAAGCEPGILDIGNEVLIHHNRSEYSYNKVGDKVYHRGSEQLITANYCEEYLESLPNESFMKIYSQDEKLLCEWSKTECDDTMKNPFDSSCYSYKMTNESAKRCLHAWRFTVTDDMLDYAK